MKRKFQPSSSLQIHSNDNSTLHDTTQPDTLMNLCASSNLGGKMNFLHCGPGQQFAAPFDSPPKQPQLKRRRIGNVPSLKRPGQQQRYAMMDSASGASRNWGAASASHHHQANELTFRQQNVPLAASSSQHQHSAHHYRSHHKYISKRTLETLFCHCSCYTPYNDQIHQQNYDLLGFAARLSARRLCIVCYESDFISHFDTVSFLLALDSMRERLLLERGILLVALSVDTVFVHRALVEQQRREMQQQWEEGFGNLNTVLSNTIQKFSMPLLSDVQHSIYKAFDSALMDSNGDASKSGSIFSKETGTLKHVCLSVNLEGAFPRFGSFGGVISSNSAAQHEKFARLKLLQYDTRSGNAQQIASNICHALKEMEM